LTIMAVIMRYIVWIAITSVSCAWEMKPLPPSPSVASTTTTTTTTIRERSVSSETVVMRSRRTWIKEQSKLALSSVCVLGGLTASPIESSAAVSSSTADKNIIRSEASPVSSASSSSDETQQPQRRPFSSAAFPKKEYTNSIVASRDTNISPLEVYETLQTQLKESSGQQQGSSSSSSPQQPRRALDVGAGAGVSTQVIYEQLGYTNIDALDWSGDAWRINVVENGYCPPTVSFYELDDERFVEQWKTRGLDKYDVIAFNFAINEDKALYFSKNLLRRDGILLAPVNTQQDYWLKQTYKLIDSTGTTVWSANDVGAWSVQFQPDVTQPTCQGIWCSPFNGFQRLQRRPAATTPSTPSTAS